MNKTYEHLYSMLEKEVNNIEQSKSLNKESLELLYYVTGTMNNFDCLMGKEEEGGMSGTHMHEPSMSGARRRDSRGRFMDSSYDNYGRSYDNYGRSYDHMPMYNDGYSRDSAKRKMVQKLETLMDDTMSENERQAIRECIDRIQ